MNHPHVLVDFQDGIALVTLHRPEVLNALDRALLEELDATFQELETQSDLRVVILTGSGKAFVAGADIKAMAAFTPQEAAAFSRFGQQVFNRIATFPCPVIAAINGFALGGGCELALACDLRIGSDAARLGQPEVNLGVIPGFGGTQRLPRLIGPSAAKLLLFTGRILKATDAHQMGLLDEVVGGEALIDHCRTLARDIAQKGPQAVLGCKLAVDRGLDRSLADALAMEADAFGSTFATADQKEGMAAFLEKRAPRFTGA